MQQKEGGGRLPSSSVINRAAAGGLCCAVDSSFARDGLVLVVVDDVDVLIHKAAPVAHAVGVVEAHLKAVVAHLADVLLEVCAVFLQRGDEVHARIEAQHGEARVGLVHVLLEE